MLDRVNRFFLKLENSDIPIFFYVVSFFFLTQLRNFFEQFSTGVPIRFDIFLHYTLFYVALAPALILFFHHFSRISIAKTAKVVLVFFVIIVLPPVIDLILTRGEGVWIGYLNDKISLRNFFFGGLFFSNDVSPGIKIEIAVMLAASFLYFRSKKSSLSKGALLSFGVYSIIFVFSRIPFLLNLFLSLAGCDYVFLLYDKLLSNFFSIIALVLFLFVFRCANPAYFKAIVKDFRYKRYLFYALMVILGVAIAGSQRFVLSFGIVLDIILYLISLIFASLFSIVTNDITDIDIDRISNKNRPLVTGAIDQYNYEIIAWISLALSLSLSMLAGGFSGFFFIVLFIGVYFLYSMPPFRFKRATFFSKIAISLNSFVLVLSGYHLLTGTLKNFPSGIWPFFLIGITAAANFIDLKDYAGDKKAGIKTLPVVFGERKAKLLISIFFIFAYLMPLWLLNDQIKGKLVSSALLLLAAVQFFLINRKKYSERPVMIVILISVLIILFSFRG
ncbi:MAG: UbiA family prenyltransferase [Candidatus Moranbacteria bacterium]|nr:UbiA family prenyltransferase [Candidatus Moranbacteria bacterium]